MRILISYPPLIDKSKGYPTLGQNRQFQYFKEPTCIYPVVPAIAATMLKSAGHEVLWNDCMAQDWDEQQFFDFAERNKPDLIVFETKTPVVKQHWGIINKLKSKYQNIKIVLVGDHVTALPEESFQESKVDFVLTGGDYDFLLKNLCEVLKGLPGTSLEPGIYYRDNGQIKNTGKFQLNHDLNKAPFIDRDLTRWHLYAHKNGNYKRAPGTYIMSARDCWWGKCSFCSWPTLYPEFRSRSVNNVLDEIGVLADRYGVKEIMDDSGTFPVGDWLREFCNVMIKNEYCRKINLDCNMRFGSVDFEGYKLMKRAGFRLVLFGLESANQKTLDRIKKNVSADKIIESCQNARKAGLYPHITIMFGYPWESFEEAKKTLDLGKYLLRKGIAYTVQATIVIPYPGSPLFEECKQNDWLNTSDWSRYDMKEPVMKIPFQHEALMSLVQGIYKVAFNPEFLLNKLVSVKDFDDMKYFSRAFTKVIGHLFDFGLIKNRGKCGKN